MASRKLIPVAALSIPVGLFISVVRCPLSVVRTFRGIMSLFYLPSEITVI